MVPPLSLCVEAGNRKAVFMLDPASKNTQHLFTSESVSDGHPDKICDQISDAVPTRRLIQTIEHFSAIYFCEVAAFCVMGNHYHLVVKFEGLREVGRAELRTRSSTERKASSAFSSKRFIL